MMVGQIDNSKSKIENYSLKCKIQKFKSKFKSKKSKAMYLSGIRSIF
jgi:hypothetical protein